MDKTPANTINNAQISPFIADHLRIIEGFLQTAQTRADVRNKWLLTTPNIACYGSVANLLRRGFSYTFVIYSQKHGSYGRHNREYVPYEVRQLGECSGIETDLLFTEDVYPLRRDSREIKEFLSQSKDDPKMQGQTILYRWIKFTDEFNKSGSSKFSMLFTEPENLNPFYAKDL